MHVIIDIELVLLLKHLIEVHSALSVEDKTFFMHLCNP